MVERVEQCSRAEDPIERVGQWIACSDEPVLLAMDAPLGWPQRLADELSGHRAGRPLRSSANHLFRRATDEFVKEKVGKQPLDVGADRIARTAHSALEFLKRLEERLGKTIEMAWDQDFRGVRAIEVYPAATLKVHGIDTRGYKAPDRMDLRKRVLAEVSTRLEIRAEVHDLEKRSDTVDAVACILAGHDFLAQDCYSPPAGSVSKKEGWIWVRRADGSVTSG